jgi:uncharacterized protein (DUF1697 family)
VPEEYLILFYKGNAMAVRQYLALLRGINVGGNNIIKMADLKSCFENMDYADVSTYIQSGNVLFKSDESDKTRLTNKIEQMLSARFKYSSCIVVVTDAQLKIIVEEAPEGFGQEADKYRYDVLFVKEPLNPVEILKNLRIRDEVDRSFAGQSVLYFARNISRASQSYLTKIITLPEYKSITIRNWNTTTRLLSIMEDQTA